MIRATLTTLVAGLLDTGGLPKPLANQARLDAIVGTIFGVLGAVAVLVMVLAGVRYITSRGEPREMAQAKNMIIYAVIGLGIVIMSYAIVAFVIRAL